MMRVMGDGVLVFDCPRCDEALEVGLHVVTVAADPTTRTSPVTGTTYGHRVQFIAEAPHLHAEFWGHLVRCHQPQPGNHPYLGGGGGLSSGIPSRAFIDDLGRRWEWCGGTDGSWQWRITKLPDDGLSMWQQEYERIQEQEGRS